MLNPFRWATYTLIAFVMLTPYWWAQIALASMMVMYSLFYYYQVGRIMVTLDESQLVAERDVLKDATLSTGGNLVALVALYKLTPFAYVAFWCAPWVAIAISSLVLAWLINIGYLEINAKNDE